MGHYWREMDPQGIDGPLVEPKPDPQETLEEIRAHCELVMRDETVITTRLLAQHIRSMIDRHA